MEKCYSSSAFWFNSKDCNLVRIWRRKYLTLHGYRLLGEIWTLNKAKKDEIYIDIFKKKINRTNQNGCFDEESLRSVPDSKPEGGKRYKRDYKYYWYILGEDNSRRFATMSVDIFRLFLLSQFVLNPELINVTW